MLIAEKPQDVCHLVKKSNKLHPELVEMNLYVLSMSVIFQFHFVAGILGSYFIAVF